MQRRDAAVILWSIAGLYAIVRGVLALTAAFYLESYFAGASVMSSSDRPYRLLLAAATELPALALLAGGTILLRRRFELAGWLYRAAPSAAEESDEPGAGEEAAPGGETGLGEAPGPGDEAAPDAAPAESAPAHEPARALDLCALLVAALGLCTIIFTIGDLAYAVRERLARHAGPVLPQILLNLLNLAIGWALVLRRQHLAGWILGRRMAASADEAARFQTAGLALFGLFLLLWYVPHVAAFAINALLNANPLHYLSRYARQYLLPPLLGIAIGLALFLGRQGARRVWRALRSRGDPDD